MKKLLSILLLITMCFSITTMVGCGKQEALYNCLTCKKEVFEAKKEAQIRRMCDKCYKKWKDRVPTPTE